MKMEEESPVIEVQRRTYSDTLSLALKLEALMALERAEKKDTDEEASKGTHSTNNVHSKSRRRMGKEKGYSLRGRSNSDPRISPPSDQTTSIVRACRSMRSFASNRPVSSRSTISSKSIRGNNQSKGSTSIRRSSGLSQSNEPKPVKNDGNPLMPTDQNEETDDSIVDNGSESVINHRKRPRSTAEKKRDDDGIERYHCTEILTSFPQYGVAVQKEARKIDSQSKIQELKSERLCLELECIEATSLVEAHHRADPVPPEEEKEQSLHESAVDIDLQFVVMHTNIMRGKDDYFIEYTSYSCSTTNPTQIVRDLIETIQK